MKTMTKKEILEGDKLIAEFMEDIIALNCIEQGQQLKYRSSWDWLMPVVEKIESLEYPNGFTFCFDIVSRSAIEVTAGDESIFFINNSGIEISSNAKFKNIYKAVVQFIKWHNQNKQ